MKILSKLKYPGIIAVWLVTLYFIFSVLNIFLADVSFSKGINNGSIKDLTDATKLNPREETYHRNLGLAYAILTKNETDQDLKQALVTLSDQEMQTAVNLNSQNSLVLKSAISGYNYLGTVNKSYFDKAKKIATDLTKLSPTDPEAWYQLATVEAKIGDKTQAAKDYKKTLELKNDLISFPIIELGL
ncbi:MAG: hypothetical protein NT141_04060 [candidate division WWE3 bacterium]|nr:hypothetical protein [candidate division WWE3 bacterium]